MAEARRSQLNEELGRLAKGLVGHFFVLAKTSMNYAEGHSALAAPSENVLKVVREIQRRNEDAVLRIKGEQLFLGELRIRPESGGFEAFRLVMEEMRRHHVGGISFGTGVDADELRRFVYALRDSDDPTAPDPYARMLERMQRRRISHVEVDTLSTEPETVGVDRERLRDARVRARLLYRKAVMLMEEVMLDARAGHALRLRECKRVVQQIVDLLGSDASHLLGLTTTRCHDAYTQNHAVNVCILSLAMGRRLAMSKLHLSELGMTALFHDLGKADVPREILDKAEELTAEERQSLEAHPLHGVKKMMRSKGLDAASSRMITGIFEHHLQADLSGYPRLPYRKLGLFARIIAIADSYDSLTSSRVERRTPLPPDKALRFMLSQGGKAYDPPLLKLFINCVGMHCVGSVLLLNTHELAVVVENHQETANWENPRVRVIADAGGREVGYELVVDLADPSLRRSVAAVLDPNLFNLDVSRYFA